MAGEAKSRIEFGNNIIQEQAICQMLPGILGKLKSKQLLTEKEAPQIPELEILWDKCTDKSHVVSLAAVNVLVELVSRHIADYHYVMNGFCNRILTTRNLLGPVHGVTCLLCLNSINDNEPPYSVRSTPHPYIGIFANTLNSWPIILQEIQHLFYTTENSLLPSMFTIFEPFFKYIFLNPKPDYGICRTLVSLFLNLARILSPSDNQEFVDNLLNLIIKHVGMCQKDVFSLGHHVSICYETLQLILNKDQKFFDKHLKTLTIILLEMCHDQLMIGLPLMSSLDLLNKITNVKPWVVVTSGSIFGFSKLLLKCSEYYLEQLINIVSNVTTLFASVKNIPKDAIKISVLVLPILQILSKSNKSPKSVNLNVSMKLLGMVATILEIDHSATSVMEGATVELPALPGNWLRQMSLCEETLKFLLTSKECLLTWLYSVETSLEDLAEPVNHDLTNITILLSSFLITCPEDTASRVLTVLAVVCKRDPTQAPYLLPLLLYKMERCSSPDLKLHILQTIPKLATHKICVKQVLQTLLVLNSNSELKPITLRLVFKLWQQQPRVYSHLEKLIQDNTLSLSHETRVEMQLAKAVIIRDICKERAAQHGEDFVGNISRIINENASCKTKTCVVLVCLAIEALQTLAAAQVLDLLSTWNVIKYKLEHNEYPFILKSICDLFSLVPSVAVDTPEYQEFKACSLTFLWKNALHQDVTVSSAAFKALSNFEPEDFILKYLPTKIYQTIIERLRNSPKIKRLVEENDENEEIDFSSFCLPGYFYTDILREIPVALHSAYSEFLQHLVRDEVSQLPRGLSHKVIKRHENTENKLMASVPVLLKKQYEQCTQPSLKPVIAASLLFCYELKTEMKRDGRGGRIQVVNNAKSYRKMLNNLLREVPIHSTEAIQNVDFCLAWTTFLSNVFNASLEARKTELLMQHDRGHINEDEYKLGVQNSSLWTRDLLTELLKTASKGSHTMQGNSLLALAGLAKVVYQNHISVGQEELQSTMTTGKDNHYKTTQDWLAMVVDTFIVILDGNVKTFGVPMDWCQQVSSVTSSVSSVLARCSAALAFSQIIRALVDDEFERLQQIIQVLHVRNPGQAKAGNLVVIQSHCSLGLGLVLNQLYQGKFSDSFGQEANLLLAKGLDVLQTVAFSPELDSTGRGLYALGLVMTSLCRNTAVPSQIHSKEIYEKMVTLYKTQKNEGSIKLGTSGLTVAYATVSLFDSDLLDLESVLTTTSELQETVEKFPEDRKLCEALGLILHALRNTDRTIEQLCSKWEKHWSSIISDNSLSPNLRVPAVNGLGALHGSEETIVMIENEAGASSKSYLEVGVKTLKQLLQSCNDVEVAGNIVWYLGRLSLSGKTLQNNPNTLPDSFDYLGEDSILNCLTSVLIEFKKIGSKTLSTHCVEILNTVLDVITQGPNDPLPPLNWFNILHPLVKHSFGSKTTELCIKFGLCSTTPTATGTFLSTWLSTSVLLILENNCKLCLYSSLDQLVRVLPTRKLKEVLENATKLFSEVEINMELADVFLNGLCSVLGLTDVQNTITSLVKETITNIYYILPMSEYSLLFSKLGTCFKYFSEEQVDQITSPTKDTLIKSVLVRNQLVLTGGKFSMNLVKSCVDLALSTNIDIDVLSCIVSTISQMKMKKTDNTLAEWIMQLLNSLGKTENPDEMTRSILALTVLSLSTNNKDELMSIVLTLKYQDKYLHKQYQDNYKRWLLTIRNYLPRTFPSLFENPEWKLPTDKVIDKLLCLCDLLKSSELSSIILETLLEFRRFDAYQKRPVWTQVAASVV